ncbi:MAG TPA: GFA family protein [Polyangiaceae bacterium]|jgi:hypothetical protein
MAIKTYTGSCHCGAVRFKADIDLAEGVNKCNCSACHKARAWFAVVPTDRVRLLAGSDGHTVYEWVPPGRAAANLHFQFCKTCGIRTFGRGERGPNGKPFCFINVAALDDVTPGEIAEAPVRYMDGRHDRYDRSPEDTRLM